MCIAGFHVLAKPAVDFDTSGNSFQVALISRAQWTLSAIASIAAPPTRMTGLCRLLRNDHRLWIHIRNLWAAGSVVCVSSRRTYQCH